MRHDGHTPFFNALPDAPLPMPKQRLEAPRWSLMGALRGAFAALAFR